MDKSMEEKKEILDHVNEHVDYPATKQDLVEACNKMSDVPEEDKKWFEKTLPDKLYNDPEEVKTALGMQEGGAATSRM